MKDDNTSDTSDEIVEIIDLTGEDCPVTQLQTEEVTQVIAQKQRDYLPQ